MADIEKAQKIVDLDKNADRRREENSLRQIQLIRFSFLVGGEVIQVDRAATEELRASKLGLR